METLLVAQHQHRSRTKSHGPARFGAFESPPSGDFRGINCRSFQSGAGILPTPFKSCTTPVTKRLSSSTPSPSFNSQSEGNNNNKHSKKSVKSSAISIPRNIKFDVSDEERFFNEFSYSELWAGPAYSNSPPPSSLPIPKFSIRPKRTVSLDLPASISNFDLHPIAKSAPPSPTRERNPSTKDIFHSADFATKTLRRILNLDIADE
ncbi:unnamed protein product [Ilex paraguariensis]|uniref:Uncharacterized protein n=1 Tax=Ilex paraguariensis TaxID=185542 RepID=A0ABC8RVL1_9AQUA